MRLLSFVRRNPLPVLGALALAFVVWVASDGTTGRSPHNAHLVPEPGSTAVCVDELVAPWQPQATAETLPKLKPGMSRAEVEGLVGAPRPDGIGAATVNGNRLTYHATYEADLTPVTTVRPIRSAGWVRIPNPGSEATDLVILEFDASKPGHPLVGVHYPDPLF